MSESRKAKKQREVVSFAREKAARFKPIEIPDRGKLQMRPQSASVIIDELFWLDEDLEDHEFDSQLLIEGAAGRDLLSAVRRLRTFSDQMIKAIAPPAPTPHQSSVTNIAYWKR